MSTPIVLVTDEWFDTHSDFIDLCEECCVSVRLFNIMRRANIENIWGIASTPISALWTDHVLPSKRISAEYIALQETVWRKIGWIK